jgi:hypothetical protein
MSTPRDVREETAPPGVVHAVPADEADVRAVLVRQHPPAIRLSSNTQPARLNGARTSVGAISV